MSHGIVAVVNITKETLINSIVQRLPRYRYDTRISSEIRVCQCSNINVSELVRLFSVKVSFIISG